MSILKLLAKKRISRQLFKVCRLHGFESLSQIESYFIETGSFDCLKWFGPEEKKELEFLINAELLRLGREWKLPQNLLRSQTMVPIVSFILEKEVLPKKQMALLLASSSIYRGTRPRNVFELAPEMAMAERNVRALRTSAIRELSRKFRSVQLLQEDLLQKYGLNTSSDLIIVDETLARQINQSSKTNFTPEFLGWLFGIRLEKEYTSLGRPEEVLAGNILGNRHYWSGFYLLRKELAAGMDFDALLAEAYRLQHNGSGGSRSLNFKNFVSHFLKDSLASKLEELLPLIEEILFKELGLQVSSKGELLFPVQQQLLLRSYCYEALEIIGKPTTREQIRLKISQMHPEYFVDLAGFGSVMLAEYGFTRHQNIFGLRKWFPEGGGSLRFQDSELLQDLQEKYPVRSAAYWNSLWKEKWQALLNFVNMYSRLPKRGATGEEAMHRKFWERQVDRCAKGILDPDHQVLLNELRRRFPHNKKKHWKIDWDERFANVKAFAETHGVPPHKDGSAEEKTMNGWLQAQRIRRKKGNLDRRQVILLTHFDEYYHLKSPKHFERQWEKRYRELEDFAGTHSRLPREIIKKEKSLNRWFAAQRLRMSKGKLDRRKYFLIKDIIARYPLMGLDYLKGCWHEKCGELEHFTQTHSRLPKSTIREEKPLYKWFQVQSLLGSRGKLDTQQLARLEELTNFRVPGHFEKHFDQRFAELKKFVTAHYRLPRKSIPAELPLYNWYMEQLRRGEKGKLNSLQQESLKRLCGPFQEMKPDWKERFSQVRTFAETHGKLPKRTAITKEEKVLNRWFMVQKDRMKRGRLVRRERKLIQFLIKRFGTAAGGHKLIPKKQLLGD